jgi:hypothetical protein
LQANASSKRERDPDLWHDTRNNIISKIEIENLGKAAGSADLSATFKRFKAIFLPIKLKRQKMHARTNSQCIHKI